MAIEGTLEAERRREGLTRLLRETGEVRVDHAAATFQVHPMTIRRDLRGLERAGLARLVRGGAVFVGPSQLARRQAHALSAKRRIAEKLVDLVPAGHAVGIDASTTLHQLAERVVVDDLLVVTYGLATFETLQERPGVRAYLTGGERDRRTGSLVGPLALRSLRSFSLSRCFLSATAVDPVIGCTEPTAEEVEMKQALASVSDHVVLAVDSSKLGGRAHVRSLAWEQVDVLVTELPPDDGRLEPFRGLVELR